MSILDGILGQVSQNSDVANIAAKVGIDPQTAEKAIAALSAAHTAPGDTVTEAAQQTGLEPGVLQQIVDHLGGEGSLGKFAQLLQDHPGVLSSAAGMLDRDGDGNPLNDVMGMAKGLFGR